MAQLDTSLVLVFIIQNCNLLPFLSGDQDMRQTAGLIFKELIRQSSACFQDNASSIIPVAFFAKYDSNENVASVWKGVWDEGVTSDSAAARIYAKELAEGLVLGLSSSQWGKKAAAAQVLNSAAQ